MPPSPALVNVVRCQYQSWGLGGDLCACPHLPSSDNIPNAVWIWDIQKLRLFAVLEQLSPVRAFQWDPQQPRLAICTGGSKVYVWSPAGCVSVQVPGEGEHRALGRHCFPGPLLG